MELSEKYQAEIRQAAKDYGYTGPLFPSDIQAAPYQDKERIKQRLQDIAGQGIALPRESRSFDPVEKPKHYADGEIECIDAIEEATKHLTGFEGMCTGNVIKYLWRWKKKFLPLEDLKKAQWYLERLIKHVEECNAQTLPASTPK